MANVLIEESSMTAIANAIRTKKGVSTTYKPAQMPDAISSIETGGVTPTGTKQISITQNGTTTEDVTNYASAEITVSVQGGGADSLASVVKNLGNEAFRNEQLPETLNFLKLTTTGERTFAGSTGCKTLVLPVATTMAGYNFSDNHDLEVLDLGAFTGNFSSYYFSGDAKLSTVILRASSKVNLTGSNAFNSTPFASDRAGGTLYVPQSLISTYQSATNWSTLLGYTNNKILAIEGSIYETQYADGTPISS